MEEPVRNYNVTQKCELIVTEPADLPQAATTAAEYRCASILVRPDMVPQALQERTVLGADFQIAVAIDFPHGKDNIIQKFTPIQTLIDGADQLDVAVSYTAADLIPELSQLVGWSAQSVCLALQIYDHKEGESDRILKAANALYQSGMAPDMIRTSTKDDGVSTDKHKAAWDLIKRNVPVRVKFAGCYDVDFIKDTNAIFSMPMTPFKSICDVKTVTAKAA